MDTNGSRGRERGHAKFLEGKRDTCLRDDFGGAVPKSVVAEVDQL